MSSSDDDTPAPTRRRRDMLKAYYGIAEDKKTQAAKTGIDAKDFDAEQFAVKLLREGKLKDLLAKDVELTGEMKKLDNQLQMLVYSNYTNFITATKLISNMKTSVVDMRGSIAKLDSSLSQVTTLSSSIQADLSHNKSEVERLLSVNSTLKKIDFLISLPDRLQECISIKAHASAVTYWCVGYEILNRHSHIKSFSHVSERCFTLMKELYTDLFTGLKEQFHGDSKRAMETINHLKKLRDTGCGGPNPPDMTETVENLIRERFEAEMSVGIEKALESDVDDDVGTMQRLCKVLTAVRENAVGSTVHLESLSEKERKEFVRTLTLPAAEQCVVRNCEVIIKATHASIKALTKTTTTMLSTDTDAPILSKASAIASNLETQLSDFITHSFKLSSYFPPGSFNVSLLFDSLSNIFLSIKQLLSVTSEAAALTVLSVLTQFHANSIDKLSAVLRNEKGTTEAQEKLIKTITTMMTSTATVFVKAVGIRCTKILWQYSRRIEVMTCDEDGDLISSEVKAAMKELERARRGVLQSLPVEKRTTRTKDGRSQTSSQSRPSLMLSAQLEAVFHSGSTFPIAVQIADSTHVIRSLCVYLLISLIELIKASHLMSQVSLNVIQYDVTFLSLSMSNICQHEDIALLTNEIVKNSAHRCPGGAELQDPETLKIMISDYIQSSG